MVSEMIEAVQIDLCSVINMREDEKEETGSCFSVYESRESV